MNGALVCKQFWFPVNIHHIIKFTQWFVVNPKYPYKIRIIIAIVTLARLITIVNVSCLRLVKIESFLQLWGPVACVCLREITL